MDDIQHDIKKINMDYNFGKKNDFLGLGFHITESDVLNKFGLPKTQIRYNDALGEYQVWYKYDDNTISIIFQYENFALDYVTFHTSCLCIEGENIFTKGKTDVLKIIESISCYSREKALDDSYSENDILYESFYFEDVGLTLWFEDEDLNDVSVQEPEYNFEQN